MITFLNLIYFIYIKINSILFRFVRKILSKYPQYTSVMDSMGNFDKEYIMSKNLIQPFNYEILKHIPNKLLYTLVYTDHVKADILFLMRIYKTLLNIPEFVALGKVKIVLICTYEDKMFTLATSFPINASTSPQQFILHFLKSFLKLSLKAYNVDSFDILLIKAFNGDKVVDSDAVESSFKTMAMAQKRLYSTQSSSRTPPIKEYIPTSTSLEVGDPSLKNHPDFIADNFEAKSKDPRRFILPLQTKDKQMTKIATFDIETFVHEGKLYPYAIGLQYTKYRKLHKIIYYYENVHDSIEENSAAILEKMVNHIVNNCKHYTIFAHNLGKFDGILMMSSIFKVLGTHSIIIGKDNSIITMSFSGVKLLDSLRIFPMSLDELAKQFGVETKKGKFDHKKVNINNVTNEEIKSELLVYLEKDLASLYECMTKASNDIFIKYHFNVSDIYSTSSLAMKHYRTNYLKSAGIPLVPKHMDEIVSEAYYGGISQVYKTHGYNLHYYDINSLYPWAMTQDMPYEYLGVSNNPKLEDSFGFIYASIYIPETLNYKPLPIRTDTTLATPSGHVLGIYFSEELKYAKSIGCQITPHKAYIYSRKILFKEYVEDIYKQKASAVGSDRVFIKLLLNGLYGFFARTDEKYLAVFLPLDEALKQVQIYPAYNIILMDDDKTALLIREAQPSKDLCNMTGHNYTDYFDINNRNRTKSNRAIAAAITGYSRIKIHEFKDLCGDIYYSDTDSIISGNKLDNKFLNNELGMMKDEFKGRTIAEGIFLSPKLYALKLDNNEEVIKARGVPEKIRIKLSDGSFSEETSLNFEHLIKVHQGESIDFLVKDRLFKSLNDLGITSKDISGKLELNIPIGKIAIYDQNGLISSYKDVHKNLFSAIKENPIGFKLSGRMGRLISKYKELVKSWKNHDE